LGLLKLTALLILTGTICFAGCGDDHDPCTGVQLGDECEVDIDCSNGYGCWCGWCIAEECTGVIEFPSIVLEKSIRHEISKENGDIRYEDVRKIQTFKCCYGGELGDVVTSLEGIQCLTRLSRLKIYALGTVDFSPLSRLTKIELIDFTDQQIDDISTLKGQIVLERLFLTNNKIVNIENFEDFMMLKQVHLARNNVTIISSLSGLERLEVVDLSRNQITDLSPLVENTGINDGDDITVDHNWIDCIEQETNIETLRGRGVNLVVDCP